MKQYLHECINVACAPGINQARSNQSINHLSLESRFRELVLVKGPKEREESQEQYTGFKNESTKIRLSRIPDRAFVTNQNFAQQV
jgi:hypothetical protein